MEKILLALVCQEFEIEEELLFSKTRTDRIQNPLAMLTYLLFTEYGKSVHEIHAFYKRRGYKKTRPTLYTYLRRGERNLKRFTNYRELKASLVEGIEIATNHGVVKDRDTDINTARGRMIEKLYKLESFDNIYNIESSIDDFLKSEFIEKRQYERPKEKPWIEQKTQASKNSNFQVVELRNYARN